MTQKNDSKDVKIPKTRCCILSRMITDFQTGASLQSNEEAIFYFSEDGWFARHKPITGSSEADASDDASDA